MKSIYLVLILALSATTACSRFTSKGRQERAYTNYVRKSMIHREKRQAWFRRNKAKVPKPDTMPLEPREATQASESSQAVPSDSNNQ